MNPVEEHEAEVVKAAMEWSEMRHAVDIHRAATRLTVACAKLRAHRKLQAAFPARPSPIPGKRRKDAPFLPVKPAKVVKQGDISFIGVEEPEIVVDGAAVKPVMGATVLVEPRPLKKPNRNKPATKIHRCKVCHAVGHNARRHKQKA